jgi:colanic acid biosynthesis protein WcaH
MTEAEAIRILERSAGDPHFELPQQLFLFVSRITPMINVDLLIKDKVNRTLLTWRDDGYSPPGWHVPGGIIRFKETAAQRISAVAKGELGTEVDFHPIPISIKEIIHPTRKDRGHFISLLYYCTLTTVPDENLRFKGGVPQRDQWMWHSSAPDNLIDVHEMYREFIDARFAAGEIR